MFFKKLIIFALAYTNIEEQTKKASNLTNKNMGILFNIISYSLGNLFLGILLTVIGVVLMFFIIQSWYSNSTFTSISYITGSILFLFLSFQVVLLCGAVTIKSYCDDVEITINNWIKNIPDDMQFNKESSQQILDQIRTEWPLVSYFVDKTDFTGHTPIDVAQSMKKEIRSFMNGFILRRIGWSLLFVACGAFVVIKTMEQSRQRQHHRSKYSTGQSRRKRYDD